MKFYNRDGVLYIRIDGKRISTKLKDTAQNRKLVKSNHKNDEFFKRFNVCKSIPTVNELCMEVLDDKEKDLKPNSFYSYLSLFNTKIKPYFTEPVPYYEPIHIDTWYKTFTDRSTLTTSEAVLRPAFEKAILKGYIKNTPFIISKPRFKNDYEIKPLNLEELNILLSAKDDFLVNYLGIACFTGLRTGEILGMKWSDIDFEKEKISVNRTATSGRLQSPKTSKSKATIDLPIEALPYFKKQRLRTGLREFIFYSPRGKNILYSSYVNTRFKKFLLLNGIESRTIYQTRHTFASLKLSMGESPEWVSYMLRHKSLNTTYKRYYKYMPRPDEKRVVIELSLTQNRHII